MHILILTRKLQQILIKISIIIKKPYKAKLEVSILYSFYAVNKPKKFCYFLLSIS